MIKTRDSIKKIFWPPKPSVFQATLGTRKETLGDRKKTLGDRKEELEGLEDGLRVGCARQEQRERSRFMRC